eukprot:m.312463 g.312463  ORF g.312463 m.312463 type:complete len:832 (+) comp16484_c0_seq30:3454-5949(+)
MAGLNPQQRKIKSGGAMFSGAPSPGLLRKLVPRIKQLGLVSASLVDVDDVVTALKDKYPEYRRQKQNIFRKEVVKAISFTQKNTDDTVSPDQGHIQKKLKRTSEASSEEDFEIEIGDVTSAHENSIVGIDEESQEPIMVVGERSGNMLNRRLAQTYKVQNDLKTPTGSPSTSEKNGARASSKTVKSKTRPGSSKRRRTVSANGHRAATAALNEMGVESNDTVATFHLAPRPSARFQHLGGMEVCMKDIGRLLEVMFTHIELFSHLGSQPPRGILLHGPPGCGKTLLAHAIAGELDIPFFKVAAPELVGSASGDSERSIRELFDQAMDTCVQSPAGCLIFIDEIDVITPKRETAQREMERRIVAQLLSCMDELTLTRTGGKPVLVIGATNRPDSLDPALRRAGRFDKEISIPIPDVHQREHILKVLCAKIRTGDELDFSELANQTPGYVGADLTALVNEASILAVTRIYGNLSEKESIVNDSNEAASANVSEVSRQRTIPPPYTEEQMASLTVLSTDFQGALRRVQPSATREGFATVPDISWDDVGALSGPRQELEDAAVLPLTNPSMCSSVGIRRPPGVLLYGPPGCGKTLLAKAIANNTQANFISVKGPELLNKFVGESERAVRQVFHRAKTSSPCIVFFDELDALCPKREDDSSSRNTQRLVNQLLTEMDGFEGIDGKQVFVVAATNRPDMIDPAMLRPGRLEKLVYVDIPSPNAREEILLAHTRKICLEQDVNLKDIALDSRCEGFTGADLAALVRESGTLALRRAQASKTLETAMICKADIMQAFEKVFPSVSARDLHRYRGMQKKLRGSRSVIKDPGNNHRENEES